MAGQFSRRPMPQGSPYSEVSPALFRQQRFWMKVAAYRPLIILAGIWVILLAIAVGAYDRLLHTQSPPEDIPPEPAAVSVYPHQRFNGDRPEVRPPEDAAASPAPSSETPDQSSPPVDAEEVPPETVASPSTGISPWSLAALVATCALGSFVLSRQLQAPPRPRKSRPSKSFKKRSQAKRTQAPKRLVPPPQTPASPRRLEPFDPNQPLVTPAPPPSHPMQQIPPPSPDTARTAEVTVVSDDTQHPLDWPQDSLVNTADMRQRRSLSSFL